MLVRWGHDAEMTRDTTSHRSLRRRDSFGWKGENSVLRLRKKIQSFGGTIWQCFNLTERGVSLRLFLGLCRDHLLTRATNSISAYRWYHTFVRAWVADFFMFSHYKRIATRTIEGCGHRRAGFRNNFRSSKYCCCRVSILHAYTTINTAVVAAAVGGARCRRTNQKEKHRQQQWDTTAPY